MSLSGAGAAGDPFVVMTGSTGLVGRGLMKAAAAAALPGPRADVTDPAALARALEAAAVSAEGRPMVVVHLAALTDTRSADGDGFERVNVRGAENVMRAARGAGAGFIYVSTDYVFSGEKKDGPFTEGDRPSAVPPGAYAASKFRAENLVLDEAWPRAVAARIAFPYGGPGPRPGLSEKMARRFEEARGKKAPVTLFSDQRICPSFVPDVARGLRLLAVSLAGGTLLGRVFHLTGEATTPRDFGLLVRETFGFEDVPVEESSVGGTVYAADLRLSTEKTRAALGWRPTPHADALRLVRREGGGGGTH